MNINDTIPEENEFVPNIQLSKQLFGVLKKPLEVVSQCIDLLIMPFLTLKVCSNNNTKIDDFSVGYYITLVDLNKIIIQSFGLEPIFVVPNSNQKASNWFGTFKIFYYMINLFNNYDKHQDENIKSLIGELRNQNKDILLYWNAQGLAFQGEQKEDTDNLNAFISAMKLLFKETYLEKLKEIFQMQCAILKLIHVNDSRQMNPENINEREVNQVVECKEEENITYSQVFTISTNEPDFDEDEIISQKDQLNQQVLNLYRNQISLTDQLYNIFQDLLGVELNADNKTKIQALLTNYSGTASYRMNSNRIIGFAQFLYSTLIKSFFNDVGQACSTKIEGFSQDRQGEATFFRFPDQIIGGTKAKPFLSNCYLINLLRDLMKCWFETIKNPSKNSINELKLLEENAEQLRKKNDQQSIRKFFDRVIIQQKCGTNLLVRISHKSENSISYDTTIYEFDNFCNVNKFDIDESDKQLLGTSKYKLIQNQEKLLQEGGSSGVKEILQNYTKVKNIHNQFHIYERGHQSLEDFLKKYIKDIQEQQSQDMRSIRQQNNRYSQNHSEGTSSDEASNLDSQIQH